jgi:hypothetical protein
MDVFWICFCKVLLGAVAGGGASGSSKGHLDYGIDGPLTGQAEINLDFDGSTAPEERQTIALDSQPQNPHDTLPYFMRNHAAPETVDAAVCYPAKILLASVMLLALTAHLC